MMSRMNFSSSTTRTRVVALQIREIQTVHERVGRDGAGERTGELEDAAEEQPDESRPGRPHPTARPGHLMQQAKEQTLQPESQPGLEEPAKQELLAERARENEHDHTDGTHVFRERSQFEMQVLRPRETRDRQARADREERPERGAERGAVEDIARGLEWQPGLGERHRERATRGERD